MPDAVQLLTISCLFLDELFSCIGLPRWFLLLFSFDDLFGNVAILSSGIEILFFPGLWDRYDLDFPVVSCFVPASGMGKNVCYSLFSACPLLPTLAQGHRKHLRTIWY